MSGGSSGAEAAQVPTTDAVISTPVTGADSKKRRTRSVSTPTTTLGAASADDAGNADGNAATAVAVAVAAAAGGVTVSSTSTEDEGHENTEFTEDENESMQDVMAKMKEVSEANAAQFAENPEKRMQLYDSKRMNRVSFNSWFEFDAYFETYMQDTFQPFRMRSSCSVEAYRRNQQKVMMTNKNSRGRRIEFPDSAIHHHRIYMCTHAMKARCRGSKPRAGQKYRGIGCIAKINVKISPSDNPSKYMVIVTDQVVTHNHPISREIYEAYPDVLLKTMRRNQIGASLLTRQPAPKFETASQTQKYERTLNLLSPLAEAMARLSDEDYEAQLAELQKVYANSITEQNTV